MNIDELIALIFGGGAIVITIIAAVLGTVCTVLPFVLLGWYVYRQSKKGKAIREQSQSWPSTAGIVLKSRVEVVGGEYTSVVPRVWYEFEVGGQTYQSGKIRPGDGVLTTYPSGDAYDIVDRYPVGSAVVVYYNPLNPADCALER